MDLLNHKIGRFKFMVDLDSKKVGKFTFFIELKVINLIATENGNDE
jgi:hypothetical protein